MRAGAQGYLSCVPDPSLWASAVTVHLPAHSYKDCGAAIPLKGRRWSCENRQSRGNERQNQTQSLRLEPPQRRFESSRRSWAKSSKQSCWMRRGCVQTLMYGTPRKRFSTIFATSRQLKSCFRTFKKIRLNAFWILFAASETENSCLHSLSHEGIVPSDAAGLWSRTLSTPHFAE